MCRASRLNRHSPDGAASTVAALPFKGAMASWKGKWGRQ
jgi:hypothetical protein